MRYWRWALVGALLLGLGIGYGRLWQAAESRFIAGIDVERARLAASGLDLAASGPIERGGFPWSLKAVLRGVAVKADRTLTAPRLVLSAPPWSDGACAIELPEGFAVADGDKPVLSADFAKGSLARLAQRLRLDLAIGRVAVAAAPIVLGPRIERLAFEATLDGWPADPRAPLSLAAWRDAGSTVEIREAKLRWGPVTLALDGTASLDHDLMPIAAFTATVGGSGRLLDALVAARITSPAESVRAKAALDRLAKDGDGRVKTSVSFQDGRIWFAEQGIGELPEPPWSRAGG